MDDAPLSIGCLKVWTSKIIARGSNGTLLVEGERNGYPIYVKCISTAAFKDVKHASELPLHPNIVIVYAVERTNDMMYIALGNFHYNLVKFVKNEESLSYGGYPTPRLTKVISDMIQGVAHLQKHGIVLQNLSPGNVFVFELHDRLSATIAGTSLSQLWEEEDWSDVFRENGAIDMFSLGCVVFYCITGGCHPFGKTNEERVQNIKANTPDLSRLGGASGEVRDFISLLLNRSPNMRLTAWELRYHPITWNIPQKRTILEWFVHTLVMEKEKGVCIVMEEIEAISGKVFGVSWKNKISGLVIANTIACVGVCDYRSVYDLMRLVVKYSKECEIFSREIKMIVGSTGDEVYCYFANIFPELLIEVYKFVTTNETYKNAMSSIIMHMNDD